MTLTQRIDKIEKDNKVRDKVLTLINKKLEELKEELKYKL